MTESGEVRAWSLPDEVSDQAADQEPGHDYEPACRFSRGRVAETSGGDIVGHDDVDGGTSHENRPGLRSPRSAGGGRVQQRPWGWSVTIMK
jgi:hypothetical protein